MNKRALAAVCATGFAFSANYTNHAPMLPALREEFAFNQASAGLLTTGIFLTHAMMQVPGGRLADRLGPMRLLTASLAWVAAGSLAIAFAGAYWQLLFWKTFAGIGTGACFTAGARYIVSIFKGRELAVAQGYYGGSIMLGSGFVIFAIPQLSGALGWRGAFLACTGLVVAATVLWAMAPRPDDVARHGGSLGELIGSGGLWRLGILQMASFGLMIVVGTWITALLRNTSSLSPQRAGLMGSLVLLLGIVTRPLGGWLTHRFPPSSLIRSALLLNAAACLIVPLGQSLWLTLAAIIALGVGCGLPYAGIFSRAAALFPGRAGAAMGLVNMVGILMILLGAPAVGYLADWTGQFRVSFFALAGFSVVAALLTKSLP